MKNAKIEKFKCDILVIFKHCGYSLEQYVIWQEKVQHQNLKFSKDFSWFYLPWDEADLTTPVAVMLLSLFAFKVNHSEKFV